MTAPEPRGVGERTPEEIAREIAARRLSGDPTQWDLTSIIAAAIRAEREARLKAEAVLEKIRDYDPDAPEVESWKWLARMFKDLARAALSGVDEQEKG